MILVSKIIVVLLIVLISCLIYLHWKLRKKTAFDKVLNIILFFAALNFIHVFFANLFYPHLQYTYIPLPYGLGYGPLLLILLLSEDHHKISWKTVLIHGIPFFIATTIYFELLLLDDFRDYYWQEYTQVLYQFIAASLIFYFLLIIYKKDLVKISSSTNKNKVFYSLIGFLFVSSSFFLLILLFQNDEDYIDRDFSWSFLHLVFLVPIFFTYQYIIKSRENLKSTMIISNQNIFKTQNTLIDDQNEDLGFENSYVKSRLPEELLVKYEFELEKLIVEQKVFLDPELKLITLADKLNIPKHHLTQLLSLKKKQNFNQYINTYRVEYACKLIEELKLDDDISFEDIAYKCGFNSKTSFNRHFKNQMSVTPSEYYSNLKYSEFI